MKRVILELAGTILVLILLPLGAASYFVNDVIDRALGYGGLGLTQEIVKSYQADLKRFRILDPSREGQYRQSFEKSRDLEVLTTEDPVGFQEVFKRSVLTYFWLGVVVFVFLALVISVGISKRLTNHFRKNFESWKRAELRLRELEEMKHWQNIARSLAHEIKGPLTPIQLQVTSLKNSWEKDKGGPEFSAQLSECVEAVNDEVKQLQRLIGSFSQFAKLPAPQMEVVEFTDFMNAFNNRVPMSWPSLEARIESRTDSVLVKMDPYLSKQVLGNVLQNAVEANAGQNLKVAFEISEIPGQVLLVVKNSGKPILPEVREKIFEPYFSFGKSGENSGLGLTIGKKIMLDQGGDIRVSDVPDGAAFEISFPRVNNA